MANNSMMIKTSSCLFFWLWLTCALLAQQSSQDIQNQMAAADVLQSNSSTTGLKTPLQSFQSYYAFWKAADAKGMFYSYTSDLQTIQLEGNSFPTDQDFTAIQSKLLQDGYSNFQIVYFLYSADSQNAKITTIISSDDQSGHTHKERMEFVFIDTGGGWKIDRYETSEEITP